MKPLVGKDYISLPILFEDENNIRTQDSMVNENAFKIYSKGMPTMRQLKNFEKDPTIALLAMAMNSGQVWFAAARELHGSFEEEEKQLIEKMKKEISNNFNTSTRGRIVDSFQSSFDKNAMLLGCACFQGLDLLQLNEENISLYSAIP